MKDYRLPSTTSVKRVIPKNSFESSATPKQKRLFTENIQRITWTHKVAPSTTNLRAIEIQEIQFFSVELKKNAPVKELLDLIDRCIPYPIVFKVICRDEWYFHVSTKRPHGQDEDKAIVDFSFTSPSSHEFSLSPELRVSIDEVFRDLCLQLSDFPQGEKLTLDQLVEQQRQINALRKEIDLLGTAIKRSKNFKEKVDLNQKLTAAHKKLKRHSPTSRN